MSEKPAPVLFIGHGSPLNALDTNKFTHALEKLTQKFRKPFAVLCISAHWSTDDGTYITRMQTPRTIHDFYGFPPMLSQVQYPAAGHPEFAEMIMNTVQDPRILPDDAWGLDHGSWAILKHMYPNVDVPVMQLSINSSKPLEYHFELGKALRFLREKNVLIIGSGNIVHNLRWLLHGINADPYPWAADFDAYVKSHIQSRNFKPLLQDVRKIKSGELSVPTWDHYIPMLYSLGASYDNEVAIQEFEGFQYSSISMRCFSFGM